MKYAAYIILFVFFLLNGALVSAQSSADTVKSLTARVGLFGGYASNRQSLDLSSLPVGFGAKNFTSSAFSGGGFLDFHISQSLALHLRSSYNSISASFDRPLQIGFVEIVRNGQSNIQPAQVQTSFTSAPDILDIMPGLTFVIPGISTRLTLGFNAGFIQNPTFYTQDELIGEARDAGYVFKSENSYIRNQQTENIPTVASMLTGISGNIAQPINISSKFFIQPEVQYSLYFSKISEQFDWKVSSLRFGLSAGVNFNGSYLQCPDGYEITSDGHCINSDSILREKQNNTRLAEEARKADELRKQQEETSRKQEQARLAEEARKADELRKQQEETSRKQEQARLAEETRKADELRKQQEEASRKQEQARLAEEARKADELRKQQEETSRKQEQARLAEETRKADELRKQARLAEEARKADELRKQQEETSRKQEQARLAEEARKADELRKQQARDSIRSLPCPPNQVKNSEGDCVDCPPGFIVSNGECIRNCGANQRLAQNGIDCECLPGFEKNAKGDCLPKQCPPGYEFNAALDCVPECPPGRRRNVAGDCEELNCPPGQHRDAAGNCVPKCNTNLVYNPKNGQCEPLTCDKPWMKRDPASGNCVPKSCDDKRQIRDSAGNCNCPPPWSLTNCSVCAEGMTGGKTIQGRDTCVPTNRGCEEGYVRSTIRDKDGKYNCIPKDYEYAFIKLYQIEAKTENVTKFNDFEEEIEPLLENALGIEKFDKAKFKHHDDGEGNLKYELRFDRFDEVTALLQKIQSGLDALYEKKYFLIKGMRYIPVPQIVPIKK